MKATFGSGAAPSNVIRGGRSTPIVRRRYDVRASAVVVSSERAGDVAVAVRKGQPTPDISTPEAVKRMLLAAKSIAYPDGSAGAAAGVSFDETLTMLGIAGEMQPKIRRAQGGAGAMALLANGEIEIGLTFLSEITDPGVEVVGPLPRAISTPTALFGFVSTHAKSPAAARALLTFLSSPQAAAAYRACGMIPGALR